MDDSTLRIFAFFAAKHQHVSSVVGITTSTVLIVFNPQWLFAILHVASHSIRQDTELASEIHVCQHEHFPPHSNSGGSCRPSFFLLPSKTCLYFLIFGNAIIEGRSSLHDFFGRYIMELEKTPEIRSINYMKKVKLRVEHGKSG